MESTSDGALEPIQPPPAPPLAPESIRPRGWGWLWACLGLLGLLALGAVLFQLRFASVQRQLAELVRRDAELASRHDFDGEQIKALQDRLDNNLQRTEQLEQQLALISGREGGADSELRRVREERVLIEVDELVTLASSQLQIARDPSAALAALSSADARLALVSRPQFFALREALARDMERLRRVPVVDIVGVSIRLDRLIQGVDSWHLLADPTRRLAPPPPRSISDVVPAGRLGWLGREVADALHDLVRIRTVEAPESLLLPAYQYQLVREQLRVRLLTARQALLARNQALFKSDLTDATTLVNRYFDTSDPLVGTALAQIKSLQTSVVDAPLPTLEDSVAALRTARRSTR